MKSNSDRRAILNIVLIIVGLFFWTIIIWLKVIKEAPEGNTFPVLMVCWLGWMLNAYIIIPPPKGQFSIIAIITLMFFIGSASTFKFVLVEKAFGMEVPITPSLILLFLIALAELILIYVILTLYHAKQLPLKSFIISTFILLTLGDLFWWLIIGFIWTTIHIF